VRIASERYTRNYDAFFEVVDQAAEKFLSLTDISLTDEEHIRFQRGVTNSMKAFELFCLGYLENSKSVKNDEKIISYFKEAINQDAEFWGAYYNLGTAYYNNEDYKQALNQFNSIIDHYPSFELAYFGRGVTYLQQQKYLQARDDLQIYLNQRADDFRAHFYLGSCAIALKRYGEAVNYLNKAAELHPNFARTFFELGNAYYATNRFRMAIYNYNQAVRLDPSYLETHKRLGESYYRMHNFSGAINEFNLVLEIQPLDPEANFMLGITTYKQALLDEYIDAFLEMYGLLKPEEIKANQEKNDGQKARIYDEMVRRFSQAQLSRSNFYEATFNLALTYQEMGKPDSALYYYQETLRINPNLAKARLVLAKFYEIQGDYGQALEQYKQSVRIDPSYFIDYPRLGKAYDDIDVLQTVIKELESEIQGDPHNIPASLSLANIFFAQGFQGKAAVLYRKVLTIQPREKTAQQMLARIGD
jgi:tetratricopeptide (TPR) repeat protein